MLKAVYAMCGLLLSIGAITYSDEEGDQIWQIQSFEPGKSLIILNRGASMFLESASSP